MSWEQILIAVLVSIGLLVLAALFFWRSKRRQVHTLLERLDGLAPRQRFQLAGLLLQDERMPIGARIIVPLLFAYLALPIDAIPDFIPFFGHLDDIVVAVVAFGLLRRSWRYVLEEHLTNMEALNSGRVHTSSWSAPV